MSNIPNNIKKMWEEAAKIKEPAIREKQGKFAAGKLTHQMTSAEKKAYFGNVDPHKPLKPKS
jgi:hypothetical protein